VNAGVDTSLARHSVRSLITVLRDPGDVLTTLDEIFVAGRSGADIFVSVFLGIIDVASNVLHYASAGHGTVYLRHASAAVEQLPVTGSLVGIPSPTAVTSARVTLQPGDVLLLATDGLTEARNEAGIMLDDEGAKAWLAESNAPSSQDLVTEIVSRLKAYSPDLGDDLALLALKIT
jgi:sigma-B regulation protein RsbU (phosphoserine phosphatase)